MDAVLKDREAVRYFPQRVEMISSPMEKRYWNEVADDAGLDWEFTEKVYRLTTSKLICVRVGERKNAVRPRPSIPGYRVCRI